MKYKTGGFTLIELLAVIAIVAVLAALLFPVIGSMRESADRAQTVSNLRLIVTAMRTDASENNGWITLRGPVWTWNFYNSHLADKGYLPKKAFSSATVLPKHDARWERDEANLFSAYGYGVRFLNGWDGFYGALRGTNGATITSADEMWSALPVELNPMSIEKQSNFWILGDSIDAAEGYQKIYMTGNPTDPWIGRFHLRYGSKAHAAFLDGHVELCDRNRLKEIGVSKVINDAGSEENL